MPLTFYDRHGVPIAYTSDDIHIYTFRGVPVAYLSGGSVYAYSGQHLGRFDRGWLRDNAGGAALYSEVATGGPMKPVRKVKPVKAVRRIRPIKAVRQIRPIKPINKLSWSPLSGDQFFMA